MDELLGRDLAIWTAIQSVAVCISSIAVTITLVFLYWQVRTATRTFSFDAIRRLQELVDDFHDERHRLFTQIPLEIVLLQHQFPRRPPRRHALSHYKADQSKFELTEEQKGALVSLSSGRREIAIKVIGRLNDIGQLVDDRIIDRRIFLGKYHTMIIRCCHVLEAVRRDEEARLGSNYGQRLLRMRQWATRYNDVVPKHRVHEIYVVQGSKRLVIYKSSKPTIGCRIGWAIRRFLRLY